MTRSISRSTAILLAMLAFAACGDDETAPEEDHTPDDAALFVNGTDVSDGLVLRRWGGGQSRGQVYSRRRSDHRYRG